MSWTVQVLLPAGRDAQQLPDWIFERSPAELKAAAMAARRRQDLEQVKGNISSSCKRTPGASYVSPAACCFAHAHV